MSVFGATVSKDAFDAVCNERDYLRKQVETLNARLQQMRLSGATDTPPLVARERQKPDPIAAAIASHPASSDPRVRAAMLARVDQDKAAGLSVDEIVLRIRGRYGFSAAAHDVTTAPSVAASRT